MERNNHWAVFVSKNANKDLFIQQFLDKRIEGELAVFNDQTGMLVSDIAIIELINEEEIHDRVEVEKIKNRRLRSLSSGEQKKALLAYCLSKHPDFIILDNPFDNLDVASQKTLRALLQDAGEHTSLIQIINRKTDVLPFITNAISIDAKNKVIYHQCVSDYLQEQNKEAVAFPTSVPKPLHDFEIENAVLVTFNNVNVSYNERPIVKDISWKINAGEFWQLIGPNGSGKSTLLTLITGDNPKGYGQDLTLFGIKKGTGETVWDIKQNVGYFTPSMTDMFSKNHTLQGMIVSGLFDSIGLYVIPAEAHLQVANEWLQLIEMDHLKNTSFSKLSLGQQRLALIARAMIKHPPLLILDEPTSGLDDYHVSLVTSLINKIAAESSTAILYVSHRREEGLEPKFIFELIIDEKGSTGKIVLGLD
ncbi:MAG TPA: ATP-binding cassette domain-containing protein [Ferruginibacter sp.]|jgi:molybdate transport system ATP-binding protein|nr:ATP-binding cassette domain-containing protein [Ferruginibacter sp.]